jgi:hypothetical protein
MTDDRIRDALVIAERFAEGKVDANTKARASRVAGRVSSDARVWSEQGPGPDPGIPADSAVVCALSSPAEVIWYLGAVAGYLASEAQHAPAWQQAHDAECATLCELVREVVGNPFRRMALVPGRLSSTVLSLARSAYDERSLPSGHLDLGRLAVLADALEEADCSEPAILSHLRSPGPHVRGCWALDLLLGKS